MKNLIILMLISSANLFAEGVYSQHAKLSVKLNNSTLKEVLQEINKQTDFTVLYHSSDVKGINNLESDFEDATVIEILDACLEQTKLTYVIRDKVIVIQPKDEVSDKVMPPQKQEIIKLKGTIIDENGEPIPFASVCFKGTTQGCVAAVDGKYELEMIEDKTAVLVVSSMGYITAEIPISGRSVIDIVLEEDLKDLAEVVVTGYQIISRERASGSFGIINSETVKQITTNDVIKKLEGQIAGLVIKDNTITIRGVGTLNGVKTPLIVIDGFPYEGDINDINSYDIENITVLKDAAAASIYGSQSANGVIVITTQRAKKVDGIKISASYNRTIGEIPDYRDLRLLDSKNLVDLKLGIVENETKIDIPYNMSNYPLFRFDPIEEAYARYHFADQLDPSLRYSESQYKAAIDKLRNINGYKQLEKHLLRRSISDQFNVSLQTSSNRSKTFASFAYEGNKQNRVGSQNERYMINLKNSILLNSKLSVDLGVNLIYRESTNNGVNIDYYYNDNSPYEAIMNEDGSRHMRHMINFSKVPTKDQGYLSYMKNPISDMEARDFTVTELKTRTQISLNYKIIEGLKLESKFQFVRNNRQDEVIQTSNKSNVRKVYNDYTVRESSGKLVHRFPAGGLAQFTKIIGSSQLWRNQLNYTREINDHQVSAVIGTEMRKRTTSRAFNEIYGYDKQTESSVPIDESGFITKTIEGWDSWALFEPELSYIKKSDLRDVSYYGNAMYTYKTNYTLTGSYRLDQANIFGTNKDARNNVLWSIGGSWNASNESFLQTHWLDRLILRATYGVNGNRPSGGTTAYLTARYRSLGDKTSQRPDYYITNPGNPDLKSERVYSLNLGLDFSVLKGRIAGSFDVYNKVSKDLLGSKSVDSSLGWRNVTVNYAEMNNKGIELNLNGNIIQAGNFAYDMGVVFTYNKSKITNVDTDPAYSSSLFYSVDGYGIPVKGHEYGRLYAYRYAGLDNKGFPQSYLADGKKGYIGDFYSFKEENYQYMGTTIAPYFGSWKHHLSYKNWSLECLFSYKFGHKMRVPVGYTLTQLERQTPSIEIANRWKKPGDEKITNVPGYIYNNWDANYANSSMFGFADDNVIDASYLRLGRLNLSYTLPKLLCKKINVSSISIQAQATNLWLLTANSRKIDPEAVNNNSLRLQFPEPKTYSLGFVVKL